MERAAASVIVQWHSAAGNGAVRDRRGVPGGRPGGAGPKRAGPTRACQGQEPAPIADGATGASSRQLRHSAA